MPQHFPDGTVLRTQALILAVALLAAPFLRHRLDLRRIAAIDRLKGPVEFPGKTSDVVAFGVIGAPRQLWPDFRGAPMPRRKVVGWSFTQASSRSLAVRPGKASSNRSTTVASAPTSVKGRSCPADRSSKTRTPSAREGPMGGR